MERKTFVVKGADGQEIEAVRISAQIFVDAPTRELYDQVAADRGEGIVEFIRAAVVEGVKPLIAAYQADPEGVAARAAERATKTRTVAAGDAKLNPEERKAARLATLKTKEETAMKTAAEKLEAMRAASAARLADIEAGKLPEPRPRKPKAPVGAEPIQA